MDFIEELLEAPYKSADSPVHSLHGRTHSREGKSSDRRSSRDGSREPDYRRGHDHREGDLRDERNRGRSYRHRDRRDDTHDDYERERHRERRYRDDDRYGRRRSRSPRRHSHLGPSASRARSPVLTEEERDKRTIFVQQLAARLRTRELIAFFSKAGPVRDAQIVKDKISHRSKGVGYVEFKDEESIPIALSMTGQKLLGIPVIAQLTEAEKNRLARQEQTAATQAAEAIPENFFRLYIGNIHSSISEDDIRQIFEAFGEVEFVQLQKDMERKSRGSGLIQFRESPHAKEALENLDGFELAGKRIRVGLGNEKALVEENMSQRNRYYDESPRSPDNRSHRSSGGRSPPRQRQPSRERIRPARADRPRRNDEREAFDKFALMKKLDRSVPNDARLPSKPSKPSPVVPSRVSNFCVDCKLTTRETAPNWEKELEEDVKAECAEKYGKVLHLAVDPSPLGEIYVKFDRVPEGRRAFEGLNGRFFGGRKIEASYMNEAIYAQRFPRS